MASETPRERASSLLVHSQPIFMGGVKRLESINIKKCRGIQELAVPAYFLAGKKTGKLPSSADPGRGRKVGRFKRHAMRSWIRTGGERGRDPNVEI